MQAVRKSSKGGSLLYSSSAVLPSTGQAVGHSRTAIGSTSKLAFKSPLGSSAGNARPVVSSTPTLASDASNFTNTATSRVLRRNSDQFGEPIEDDDDELIELVTRAEERQSVARGAQRYSLRCASNDFGPPIEEDDDEVIELVRCAEDHAHPEDHWKSPPSRARKLNIRETHAHDDYGGALLSEEERKLLGTSLNFSHRSKLTPGRRH